MKEIESEMGALKDVITDVHGLVEQGKEGLDHIEGHVSEAETNTKHAVDELIIANKWACSARWKVLIIVIICLAILCNRCCDRRCSWCGFWYNEKQELKTAVNKNVFYCHCAPPVGPSSRRNKCSLSMLFPDSS